MGTVDDSAQENLAPASDTVEVVSTSLWLKEQSTRGFDLSSTSSIKRVMLAAIKQSHRIGMYQYIDMH